MKYKEEDLQRLAKQVLENLQEPYVKTGILFLSMATQNSPEECIEKIKQLKNGTFNYD